MEHTDPPWTPHMPGISPTPSQPCTIHTPMNPLLSQSTWSVSFKYSVWNIKVVATPLTSSRMFHYVMRSDLAIFNFFSVMIQCVWWGVTYMADTCLLTIHPGGSYMTPPVSFLLDHITTNKWLPPSMLLWLSTRSLLFIFSIVLPRYISQACWVASSPRFDFFHCTTVLW